jgi:hypothetical protein
VPSIFRYGTEPGVKQAKSSLREFPIKPNTHEAGETFSLALFCPDDNHLVPTADLI